MDKLSSFMCKGLSEREETRKLFTEAGCGSLLEAHEKLKTICKHKGNDSIVSEIINYLRLDSYDTMKF